MAGGIALGASVKSGIGDDADAPGATEGIPNAVAQRQRTIVRERRNGRRYRPWPVGDCEIGAVGSIRPSPARRSVTTLDWARAMPSL